MMFEYAFARSTCLRKGTGSEQRVQETAQHKRTRDKMFEKGCDQRTSGLLVGRPKMQPTVL